MNTELEPWFWHDTAKATVHVPSIAKEVFIAQLLQEPERFNCCAGFDAEQFVGWCFTSWDGAFYCRGFEFDMLQQLWAGQASPKDCKVSTLEVL